MAKIFKKEIERCGECLYYETVFSYCSVLADQIPMSDSVDPDCPLPDAPYWSDEPPTVQGFHAVIFEGQTHAEPFFCSGMGWEQTGRRIKLWHYPAIEMPEPPGEGE